MIKQTVSALLLVIFFCAFQVSHLYAQNPDKLKVEGQLPLDPEVRYGKLENGFTYYIRRNKEPQNKILMSLVVKVGAFHEEEDQMELAHFMEHMALKGTKHFPNLLADLAKLGLKPGSDVNGTTSSAYTQYDLTLPSDNSKIFETGLQVIHDFGKDVQFNQEAIDSEREVMLGEYRLKQHISSRMENQYLPKLYDRFRDHSTLETEIRKFKPESLIRFYKDWYRPDLQALILVGDIQVDKTEQEIRSFFSDLKNPENPRERKEYNGVNLTGRNQLIIATDKEMGDIDIDLYIKQPDFVKKSREDFKKSIIRDLYNTMMSERFSEISNQYNSPWNYGWSTFSENPIPVICNHVTINPGFVKSGFQAVIIELERVKRFGFSERELTLARTNFNRAYLSKDKIDSHSLIDEYRNHYVTGEAALGLEHKWNMIDSLIREITAKDVNTYVKECITDVNQDIVINAPEKGKSSLPDKTTVRNWMSEIKISTIKLYREHIPANFLLTKSELAKLKGSIDSSLMIEECGITELRLSNGIRVVLKPFKPSGDNADKILLRGFSPGGASFYTGEDYYSALHAGSIVLNSGVGPLDKLGLFKYLSGRSVAVIPYIKDKEEGINGSSTINDFEMMMQLTHLYFKAPRKSEVAFKDWINKQISFSQKWTTDIHHVFSDSIANVYNEVNEVGQASELGKINPDRSFSIYKELFANAGDFTFVLTGDFDPSKITTIVTKYLGSLPSVKKKEAMVQEKKFPEGPISKVFYTKQKLDGAMVELDFAGPYQYNTKNNVMLTALCRVLNIKLFDRLRTQEGGVYFVAAWPFYYKNPDQYRVKIEFKCAPAQLEKLIAATLEEIEKIKADGLDAETFKQAISTQKNSYEYRNSQNDFWLMDLVKQYQLGEDPKEISQRAKILASLTSDDLKTFAKEYLNGNNLMRFVLLPEGEEQK